MVRKPQGAAFCSTVRGNAFLSEFCTELTPVAVAAGVNSFGPDQYRRLSEKLFFSSQKIIPSQSPATQRSDISTENAT